jgi:hypothetical protein
MVKGMGNSLWGRVLISVYVLKRDMFRTLTTIHQFRDGGKRIME